MKIGKIIWFSIVIGLIGCQANPNELNAERNILKGIQLSMELKKPIFLHFTCHGCVGYNEFYKDLITSRKILNKLNEEFVVIELYTDDNGKIHTNDTLNLHKIKVFQEGREKIKNAKTIGNINTIIEADWLKRYSQPLYLITDSELNILVEPFGYTQKNRVFFLAKLEEGLKEFKNK